MERPSRRAWLRGLVPRAADVAAEVASAHLETILPDPPLPVLVLHTDRCLPFRGPECGACAGVCPPEVHGALTMVRNRPVIDPALCVACGDCVRACPTLPKALELLERAPAKGRDE